MLYFFLIRRKAPTNTMPMQSSLTEISSLKTDQLFNSLALAAFIFNNEAEIVCANKSAKQYFDNNFKKKEKIHSIFVDKKQFDLISTSYQEKLSSIRKIGLIKRSNSETEIFEISVQNLIGHPEFGILCLNPINENSKLVLEHISQSLIKDIQTLRPYLNKTGKEILDRIIKIKKQNKALHAMENMRNEIILNDRISELLKLYPNLSPNEIDLCVYLSMRLNYKQIASINNKLETAIRVSVHRMLKKMELKSLNDLLNILYKEIETK